LRRKKNTEIAALLKGKGYDEKEGGYNYLVKLPMDSVSEESVEKILGEKLSKETLRSDLERTTVENLWSRELKTITASSKQKRRPPNKVLSV